MSGCLSFIQFTKSLTCNWEKNIIKIASTYLLKTLCKILGVHCENHCFSKWHKNAFAGIGPSWELIATSPTFLYVTLSNMKNDSCSAKVKSILIFLRSKLSIVLVSLKQSSIQMAKTYFKGILVNNLSPSRPAMNGQRKS